MKNIFNTSFPFCLIFSVLLLFSACKDNNSVGSEEEEDKPYLELSESKLNFNRFASEQYVTIDTNVKDITYKAASKDDWYSVNYSADKLTVSVTDNTGKDTRLGTLTVEAGTARKILMIAQEAKSASVEGILNDIKIPVKSGEASSFQPGSGIEKSFDGDFNTIYHSAWNNSATDYFPVTLTYNFENATAMDYLVYYPRREGYNGFFKEFELWVATKENPRLAKYGDYDFQGSSSAGRISFIPALAEPVQIQFVVKSGYGDDQGFASCAEMEFYRKNPDNFDYLTVFSDVACTKLKPAVTEQDIDNIPVQFFKDLAIDIYKGIYDDEFRIQEYKPWQHPDVMAKINKTSTYSLRDNPTGIYVKSNEDLIVFADDMKGQNLSLFIQDHGAGKDFSGSSYPLSAGMNKIKSSNSGLIYIMYYMQSGTEPSVKIHIAGGTVNGYFDKVKHKTKEEWEKRLAAASFDHFDVIGEYAHLTFETAAFRAYTQDKGLELIDLYDDLVYREQEFMGLKKYNKMYKNRSYFLCVYGDNYMYATGNYTGYNTGTQKEVLNPAMLKTTAVWGPAHELGHTHQTRPGLRWTGMTEVTNNIHSQYIQTLWGNPSRLMSENLGGGQNRYQKALSEIVDAKQPHNYIGGDVFCKLVPFWQLKLYMHDALGKTDFYPDLYEKVRISPDPGTQGECQLQFVKFACEVANLDLTDFFETWGFLRTIDEEIDDYGKDRFVITQQQIDNLKNEIANGKYPKPKHTNIHLINDKNVDDYK